MGSELGLGPTWYKSSWSTASTQGSIPLKLIRSWLLQPTLGEMRNPSSNLISPSTWTETTTPRLSRSSKASTITNRSSSRSSGTSTKNEWLLGCCDNCVRKEVQRSITLASNSYRPGSNGTTLRLLRLIIKALVRLWKTRWDPTRQKNLKTWVN